MYLALFMPNDANFVAFLKLFDRSQEQTKSPTSLFHISEFKVEEFTAYQMTCAMLEYSFDQPQGQLTIFYFLNIRTIFHFNVDHKLSIVKIVSMS